MNRLRFREKVGFTRPYRKRLKQAKTAVFGEVDVPRSKAGLSSLAQLYPKISPKLWKGQAYLPETVIISNLFNHTQTPIEEGWSVAKTQIKDFRGKGLTYNSHNGTDFAIPTGTKVCTAAPGKVVLIHNEFNRGGLKIYIDHGEGLMTCYAHLARALVQEGDLLTRGQIIALSGYSGIDGMMTYPFGIPHVHFNVWLNGDPIDPFPIDDQVSLWLENNLPRNPMPSDDNSFKPSKFDEQKLESFIRTCKTRFVREELEKIPKVNQRAHRTIIASNYYPTRFPVRQHIYSQLYPRVPRLTLPFLAEDFNQVVFLDEIQ